MTYDLQEAQKPTAEQRPLPARPERLNAILMGTAAADGAAEKCSVEVVGLNHHRHHPGFILGKCWEILCWISLGLTFAGIVVRPVWRFP